MNILWSRTVRTVISYYEILTISCLILTVWTQCIQVRVFITIVNQVIPTITTPRTRINREIRDTQKCSDSPERCGNSSCNGRCSRWIEPSLRPVLMAWVPSQTERRGASEVGSLSISKADMGLNSMALCSTTRLVGGKVTWLLLRISWQQIVSNFPPRLGQTCEILFNFVSVFSFHFAHVRAVFTSWDKEHILVFMYKERFPTNRWKCPG